MNDFLSQGGLVPIWILGAALVLGGVQAFMSRGSDRNRDRDDTTTRDYSTTNQHPNQASQPV